MGGISEVGGAMLVRAEQLVAASAQNLANSTTPGYRAFRPFGNLILADSAAEDSSILGGLVDASQGKLIASDNPNDLALQGDGFFLVHFGGTAAMVRSGTFRRDTDGRITTPDGGILQTDHGDLVVGEGDVRIDADGSVMVAGDPAGRLAIVDVADPASLSPIGNGAFVASGPVYEVNRPEVRQGMLESSNVSSATEMLSIMSALRTAEAGQQIIQTYQDLLGQAINSFGQRGS